MMSEYAKSKELHKALRVVWDPSLKPLGFKRCKASVASYFRPRHDETAHIRFWAQASQWGDSWSGNSFTLNIDTSIADPHDSLGNSRRFLGYLTPMQLVEAERMTKDVFAQKPKPQAGHWIYDYMADDAQDAIFWKSAFEKAFTYTPGLLKPGHDVWLHYFSVEDVKRWAEFLAPLLPELLVNQEET